MNSRITMVLGSVFLGVLLAACGGGGGGGSDDGGGTDVGGGGVVDTKAPYVVSTNPVLNSTAVETNRAITVTFNEAIEPATITSISFLVDNETGGIVAGTVAYDSTSWTATFRTGALSPATTYIATITTDVEDLAGNPLSENYVWKFTTGSATIDTTPPAVLSRFPAPNAISVAPNAVISVTFNEPIDPFTINTNALTLNGTSSVSGNVSYVGTTALFKPAANLTAGIVYTVTVAETIKDLAGNPLGTPVVWNFTTGNQVDVQAPQVKSVSPPNGEDNVPTNSSLVVTFDEAIKPFELGIIDGKPVTVTFNDSYTTATMKPTAGLRSDAIYTVNIRASDLAGNFMDEVYVWKFTTAP